MTALTLSPPFTLAWPPPPKLPPQTNCSVTVAMTHRQCHWRRTNLLPLLWCHSPKWWRWQSSTQSKWEPRSSNTTTATMSNQHPDIPPSPLRCDYHCARCKNQGSCSNNCLGGTRRSFRWDNASQGSRT